MLTVFRHTSCVAFLLLSVAPSLAEHNLATLVDRATVRLECSRQGRNVYGSGTVVERNGADVMIATCGHLFRGLGGPIVVDVTFFTDDGEQRRTGRIIGYDQHLDVGLVKVNDAPASPVIPLAPRGTEVMVDTPVLVAGCDGGREPIVEFTSISANGRFAGRPNIEVSAVPVQGRSGGALVTMDGRLLGVCNSFNPDEKEGIYAGVEAIYQLQSRPVEQQVAMSESTSQNSSRSDMVIVRSHYAIETEVDKSRSSVNVSCVISDSANGGRRLRYDVSNASDALLRLLRREGRLVADRD